MTTQEPLDPNDGTQSSEAASALQKLVYQLENSVPPQLVLSSVCKTLVRELHAAQAGISLRRLDSDDFDVITQYRADEGGAPAPLHQKPPLRYPITFRGETIGQLEVWPATPPAAITSDVNVLLGEIAHRTGSPAHV
ncbi:MAG: hypothetical protein M1495_10070, partial [Bacteroidetes bacterium]|nr:hypothetical protein [Bacteroidota bacterium]